MALLKPAIFALTVLAASLARADDLADVQRLLKAGNAAEALKATDKALASNPKDAQLRFLRGVTLTELGRNAEAITTFVKLSEDYPELPEPFNNLAVLYAGQGQYDKARTALEMAIRTNPSYGTAYENLGDVYAKLASQAYAKALQVDAGNQAVAPKLALMRDLFSPKSRVPAVAVAQAPAPAPKPPAPAPAPAPVPAPAAPTPPAPAPVPVPAPKPPVVVAAAPSAAVPAPAPKPAPAPAPAPTPAPAPAPAAAPKPPVVAAAPAPAPAPAPKPAAVSAEPEITAAVQAWASAWARKDMPGYFAAYAKEFDPGKSRSDWEADRKLKIAGKPGPISVKVSDFNVVEESADKAVIKFRQAYSGGALNVTSLKTLNMVKSGGQWQIVRESSGS
jgi:Tetratricopeptide repeat/TPR repeat